MTVAPGAIAVALSSRTIAAGHLEGGAVVEGRVAGRGRGQRALARGGQPGERDLGDSRGVGAHGLVRGAVIGGNREDHRELAPGIVPAGAADRGRGDQRALIRIDGGIL
jgi:hypothetical protein